jgi:hypothetical protein
VIKDTKRLNDLFIGKGIAGLLSTAIIFRLSRILSYLEVTKRLYNLFVSKCIAGLLSITIVFTPAIRVYRILYSLR